MKRELCLVLAIALTACTSAAEKEKRRQQAMIEQAREDAAAEAEFVADSVKLAASITMDTVSELRQRDERTTTDDGADTVVTSYHAVTRAGQLCVLTFEKYKTTAQGDTLSCQWSATP
jgi:hypothetical protein